MEVIFADTFYFVALINDADENHDSAMAWSKAQRAILVTTDAVLIEVADGLAGTRRRGAVEGFVKLIRSASWVDVVPIDQELMDTGLALFASRPDKKWSLTDCMSFVVMRDRKIAEALTHDHHFRQAGFATLF